MTRITKITIAVLTVILGVGFGLVLRNFFSDTGTVPTGEIVIRDGHVSAILSSHNLELVIDAHLNVGDYTELSTGRGRKIDYIANRVEILENIFGSIEGITGIAGNNEEFPIANLADLDQFIEVCKQYFDHPSLDVNPDDLSFGETYVKGDVRLHIHHREGEFHLLLPFAEELDLAAQVAILQDVARALDIERYFDFEDVVIMLLFHTAHGAEVAVVPTRVDGLPVIAVSRDVCLDRDMELFVLQYVEHHPVGLSIEVLYNRVAIRSERTVLPLEVSQEKHNIISVEEAINALRENLNDIYIEGVVPKVDKDFVISEIKLAYAAVYDDHGFYDLVPVYAFIPERDIFFWDRVLFVNAHSGEVYPAISLIHMLHLNPWK